MSVQEGNDIRQNKPCIVRRSIRNLAEYTLLLAPCAHYEGTKLTNEEEVVVVMQHSSLGP